MSLSMHITVFLFGLLFSGSSQVEVYPNLQTVKVYHNAEIALLPCHYKITIKAGPLRIRWNMGGVSGDLIINRDTHRVVTVGENHTGRVSLEDDGASLLLSSPGKKDEGWYACTVTVNGDDPPSSTTKTQLVVLTDEPVAHTTQGASQNCPHLNKVPVIIFFVTSILTEVALVTATVLARSAILEGFTARLTPFVMVLSVFCVVLLGTVLLGTVLRASCSSALTDSLTYAGITITSVGIVLTSALIIIGGRIFKKRILKGDEEKLLLKRLKRDDDDFVKTKAYDEIIKYVLDKNVLGCSIVGNTGDGRTTAARNAALALNVEQGYTPVESKTMEDIKQKHISEKKQTFIVDDPFVAGHDLSTYREAWGMRQSELDKFLLPENKFILIFQAQVWEENRSIFNTDNPPFDKVVNLTEFPLSIDERKAMVTRAFKKAGHQVTDAEIDNIVETGTKVSFPQCCKMVATSGESKDEALRFLRQPEKVISNQLYRMYKNDTKMFCVLYLVMTRENGLEKDFDNDYFKRIVEVGLKDIKSKYQLASWNPTNNEVKRLLKRLTGTYLKEGGNQYVSSHDWLRQKVCAELDDYQITHDSKMEAQSDV